jgi:hypothetical protein
MKRDRLRDAMHAAPFQPFIIHVADGNSARVPHPDFIALLGSRTEIVTSPSENAKPPYRLIDIPMITQFEIEGAPGNDA